MKINQYIFSTIIGIIIGGLAANILGFLWSPPLGRSLQVLLFWSWAPIFFLTIFSYILMVRFNHLWKDIKIRLLSTFLAIVGYTIGWYVIGLPNVAPGILNGGIVSIIGYFFVGIIAGLFISIYTFSFYYQNALATGTGIVFTLLLAWFITKDMKTLIKRILIAILLIFLTFWPKGIIIPT